MYIHENRLVFLERPKDAPKQEAAKKMIEETWKVSPFKGVEIKLSAESAQALAKKEAEKIIKGDGKKLADFLTDTKNVKVNPADVAKKNGYDSVGEYEKGVAIANKNGLSFVVDEKGDILSQEYFEVEEYHDGIAWASTDDGYVMLNLKGKEVDGKIYTDAQWFFEGKAAVKDGKKWHFIDTKGQDLKFGEYDETYPFFQGVAGVRNGPYWKFLKADGSKLNDKSYSKVEDFDDGFAHAKRGNTWYVVDLKGKEQLAPKETAQD